MKRTNKLGMIAVCCALTGVTDMKAQNKTFGDDLKFLAKNTEAVILSESTGQAKIVVSPKLQGRILTSTAAGDNGLSFGWINRTLISSDKPDQHINTYGGEDRFWLGPEGGQYSIFFKKDVPFALGHWFTPAPIDTEQFELVSKSNEKVLMKKDIRLENYSGTCFKLRVDREVSILESKIATQLLNTRLPANVKLVAFQSNNRIINTGKAAWDKSTGLLSIWILGMFNPSPATTIVIPYKAGPETELGPIVNDAYFGKVPADRLVISTNVLFFKGDGQARGKIGLSPQRAKPVLGSYDSANKVLTIVQYTKPEGALDYVNSMWELQKEPYRGDTINSYNDGPAKSGAKPLGPFYELETSSPAAALAPGKTLEHVHRTFHLQGDEKDLDPVARAVLGVSINEIIQAFNPKH